jgi:O-antigen ligase
MTLPKALALPLLMLLAASSLNTKAMGAAWVLLVVVGFWAVWRTRQTNATDTAPWIKTWLIACAIAMVLKTVPTLYWADPWAERQGEIRLLLGALAAWGLSRWRTLDDMTIGRIAHAFTISSALGLAWVLYFGRGAVCTHPIPWAMVMALVSCWLLIISQNIFYTQRQRRFWLTGSAIALMAVLSSRSRGAFGVVLLWSSVWLLHIVKQAHNKAKLPNTSKPWWPKLATLSILTAVILSLSQTPVLQRPAQAIAQAVEEIQASQKSAEEGSNSSVGARLYMWQRSWQAIEASPWIGYGHDGRKALLKQWATQANSEEVKKLGHVHNEYLNQLIDHGVLGLLSQCMYLIGLVLITKQLWQTRRTPSAISIACIGIMHFSGSMSNVNFAHNYYTTGLSLLIILTLWMAPAPDKQ